MKKFYSWLSLFGFLILISGCGFHLRGYESLPPQLHLIYVESNNPYGTFTKQLKQTLRAVGVTVVEDSQLAPITLQILSENITQQLTGQGTNGQLSTYLLIYTVTYQVLSTNGCILQGVQTVMSTHSYSVSANQVLGDTNVKYGLEEQMRREVIDQILNRLSSRSTLRAIQ